jgi:rhamnose transport system ATP-binding protein
MSSLLLESGAITKTYAGVRALNSVSFDLRAGEVHALIGENGAGKSTLIKVITGAVTPDSGRLAVRGEEVTHNTPAVAHSLGIVAIYQQPSLFPHLTVAENIAIALAQRTARSPHPDQKHCRAVRFALRFWREKGGPWHRIDWSARNRKATELLDRIGASIDPQRTAGTLSMPEQQLVEIAKALGSGAKILIMDEPTASLTDREVERLFQVIVSLRADGAGIVYISHRLDEIFAIADRITVLRDGESIATRDRVEIERAVLIEMMAGRAVSAVFPKHEVPLGKIALEVRNLSAAGVGLKNISFTLRHGEILGVAGLVGSGRTELAETIFGLRPADSGEILLDGKNVHIGSPRDGIQAGLAYVPEDRRHHGVVLEMSISANASLASLKSISRLGWILPSRERDLAERYVSQLAIKTPSLNLATGALSGGNQQKVALARWLATEPSVLILDEPTQGVDIAAKAEIHRLMVDLAERGLAVLMISSELPEILGMADRIAIMRSGAIAGVLSRAQATPQGILSLALGHVPTGEMARVQ